MKKENIVVQYRKGKKRRIRKESVMPVTSEESRLFDEQVKRLQECHFLILYWATVSEDKGVKYNITNLFDDLKYIGITRTKQTAVAAVASLVTLCYIDLREEHNRKNIYITRFGAKALESMVLKEMYKPKSSPFLEGR